jgi:hypothetical protein
MNMSSSQEMVMLARNGKRPEKLLISWQNFLVVGRNTRKQYEIARKCPEKTLGNPKNT